MKLLSLLATFLLAVIFLGEFGISPSSGQDYSKSNRDTFEKIFSPRKFSEDRWHFVGLPLSGNVLGTARRNEKGLPLEDRVKLINPDKWFDKSLGEEERQELNKAIIDTYSVGPIDLDETTSKTRGGSISFPGLFQALGLKADASSTKGLTVKMHVDKATVRELNYSEFAKAYNAHKFDPSVYDALKQDIIMCFADVQFTGLKVHLIVDATKNSSLEAKLNKTVGNVLGADSGLSLKADKTAHGTFVIEPAETVTVAYMFRPIPKKEREVDPTGYLLLNASRGEAHFVATDDALERELSQALSLQKVGQITQPDVRQENTQEQAIPQLVEEQAGDPGMAAEGLSLDRATKQNIADLLAAPSRGPKVARPQLALETLNVAKTHIGNSRKLPAKLVKQYLALYGLPFQYPNGRYVPFCASGIGFAACQAYRKLTGQSTNLDDPNVAVIFRDSLSDVKRDFVRTHPACVEMVQSARSNGTWQPAKAANGSRVLPKPGWLVFYNWNGGSTPQHVGIIDHADAAYVYTVEFNTSGKNFSNGGAVLPRRRPYSFVIGYIDTYKEPNTQ